MIPIPRKSKNSNFSFKNIQLKTAARGGANDIRSKAIRGPVIVNALNKNKSPKNTPIKPESASHNHPFKSISCGKNEWKRIKEKQHKKQIPMINRQKLTDNEPIRLPAPVKAKAVKVQKNAVSKAANSPK